ncbi:MAG: flagellar hook-basal body complex protein [Planctomycetota bacterium]
MNYGLYIAASAASAQTARQDLLAGNLANVNTTAFSPDSIAIRQREVVRVEDNLPFEDSNALIERLGAGVMPLPTRTAHTQGPLEQTGSPLDIALEGSGFLVVREGQGPDALRLTRDGRMAMNDQGVLVSATDGAPILGTDLQPIRLDPAQDVRIASDGRVLQGEEVVARLGVRDVADTASLHKSGRNRFDAPGGLRDLLVPAEARVIQGSIEGSSVNPISTIMGLTNAGGSVRGNLRTISLIDEIMGRAISLGTVSG